MSDKNRAAVYCGPQNIKIEERDIPIPGSGEILVRSTDACICATEVKYWYYGMPRVPDGTRVVQGHELSGIVEDVGSGVKNRDITGTKVAVDPSIWCDVCDMCKSGLSNLCRSILFMSLPPIDGGNQQFYTVPERNIHKIPDNMPSEWGSIVEPVSIGINAIAKAENMIGSISDKTVAIVGAGPQGLLLMQVAAAIVKQACVAVPEKQKVIKLLAEMSSAEVEKHRDLLLMKFAKGMSFGDMARELGLKYVDAQAEYHRAMKAVYKALCGKGVNFKPAHTKICVVEPLEYRRKIARKLGANVVTDPSRALDEVMDITDGAGADVVFEVAGESDSYQTAATLAKPDGLVVIVGIPSDQKYIPIEAITARRAGLTLMFVRRFRPKDFPLAVDMIASGAVEVADLITHHFPLSEITPAFEMLHSYSDEAIKVVLHPHD